MRLSVRYVSSALLFASALTACGDDTRTSGAGTGDATTSSGANSASSSTTTTTAPSSSSGDGGSPSTTTTSGDGGNPTTTSGDGGNPTTSDGGGGSTSDGGGGSTSDGGGGAGATTTASSTSATSTNASSSTGGDVCAGDCFDTGCNPGFSCVDDGPGDCGVCACPDPTVEIDPLRSIYIRDPAVLTDTRFSFVNVLNRILASAEVNPVDMDARDLYIAWFDTNNDDAGGVANGIHCDTTLNGFPLDCPRQEGVLAQRAEDFATDPANDPLADDHYKLVAVVARTDKIPLDGSNCGQYRFSYSLKDAVPNPADPDFNYLIFEGVLPNPTPLLGAAGCLPVAQYVVALDQAADAAERADLIAAFFFDGLPGFEPILDWRSFRGEPSGAGQLRTNQFILSEDDQAWAAREYYLARTGAPGDYRLIVTPETVKENAYGRLFNAAYVDPRKAAFEDWFVDEAVQVLAAATNVNDIIFAVPKKINAGQSTQPGINPGDFTEEDGVGDYVAQATGNTAFLGRIQNKIDEGSSGLTALQVVARAEQQTCAGCHQLVSFSTDIGGGLNYFGTGALGFVHTIEDLVDDNNDNILDGYRMSDALTQQFLPRREQVLEDFIAAVCAGDGTPDGMQLMSLDSSPQLANLLPRHARSIGGGLARGH